MNQEQVVEGNRSQLGAERAERLRRLAPAWRQCGALLGVAALMAACGGGSSGDTATAATDAAATSPAAAPAPSSAPPASPAPGSPPAASPGPGASPTPAPAPAPAPAPSPSPAAAPAVPMTVHDAVRLADQGSFGPTESLVAAIQPQGAAAWIKAQIGLSSSRYTSGNGGEVNQYTGSGNFCDGKDSNCWRDWSSTEPLVWDFYRNALTQPDQLRQRVAFALQQIVVVSNLEVSGTYGFRLYYNNLLDNAFGNYRQVLKKVALSPIMGDFLNSANNDKAAPNENFARELLQLFGIGTCALNPDGTLHGGACSANYSNDTVRAYAYAMTGWTYPAGGATPWGCWPTGMNCTFYGGDMVPVASYHDTAARTLLSGVTVAANTAAPAALEAVLDSLMGHPNIAPFIGRQLIQHLVGSNPSPAYVARVAAAFNSGIYQPAGFSGHFGVGAKGDLAATVAAVLLDTEARGATVTRNAGKLREPAQMFAGVLRALNGKTDGDALSWWWGDTLREHMFRPPSVFNFYAPDYPVPGTSLVGPTFGIHNASAALDRLNYLAYLIDWGGSTPSADIPNAIGTSVNLSAFLTDAADAGKLVDRLSMLALGQALPTVPRAKVVDAVAWWTASTDPTNWKTSRVKAAAYLVFASPNYQVLR
jgi:Protein of unknown function (DUF1800)